MKMLYSETEREPDWKLFYLLIEKQKDEIEIQIG